MARLDVVISRTKCAFGKGDRVWVQIGYQLLPGRVKKIQDGLLLVKAGRQSVLTNVNVYERLRSDSQDPIAVPPAAT